MATCCSVRRKKSGGTQVTGLGWAPATQLGEKVAFVVFPVSSGDTKQGRRSQLLPSPTLTVSKGREAGESGSEELILVHGTEDESENHRSHKGITRKTQKS